MLLEVGSGSLDVIEMAGSALASTEPALNPPLQPYD